MSQADQAPDKIDAHYRQQLSALLDGALSPDEARFLLRRLQHDEELGECWSRWQLCGDILRGQTGAELPGQLLPSDFATRVARAIAADSDHHAIASSTAKSQGWLRWGGSAALAASVALVAVIVMRQNPEQAATAADPFEVATTPAPAIPVQDTVAPAPTSASVAADNAALAAGVAVAATQAPQPRRIAATRAQVPATSFPASPDIAAPTNPDAVADTAAAPTAVAVAAPTGQTDVLDGFVLRQPPQSRPWPRALIPTLPANGGFTVGHAGTTSLPAFQPFQVRTPVIESEAEAGEDANAGVEASPPR